MSFRTATTTTKSAAQKLKLMGVPKKSIMLIDLPAELLHQIVGDLTLTSHAHLCLTCRHLQAVLDPELYRRDRSSGAYLSLSWAACYRRPRAAATIQRAMSYWPPGTNHLQCYFTVKEFFCGKDLRYLTPLIAAVQAGNKRIVQFLLSQGVDVNQCEEAPGHRDTLWCPIHHAVTMDRFKTGVHTRSMKDKLHILGLLLDHGANPNQLSSINPRRSKGLRIIGFVTPMHLAIANNADHHVIDLLIKKGAAATRVPYHGVPDQYYTDITPISHLVHRYPEANHSQYLAVQTLTKNGGGIGSEAYTHTATGESLLIESLSRPRVSEWSVGITKLLLSHACVQNGDTAHNGDGAISHHVKSHLGWKPIKPYDKRWILKHEELYDMERLATTACSTIDVLLEHGANIDQIGARGWTPLHVASGIHKNYSFIFNHLLTRGANVRARTTEGFTLLHTLVKGEREAEPTLLSLLIKQYKLHRYARDKAGNTFLHHLCSGHVVSLSKWMMEVAMYYKRDDFHDPRLQNMAGLTPLETATSDGDADIIQFWIDDAFHQTEVKQKQTRALNQ